jgi:protein-S-isoprenylcysteine O-methyltransferase Ste14
MLLPLVVASFSGLGRNTRAQKAATLNTIGSYSLVRHPLYVGTM